jgi:plastocyanin
MRSKVCVAALVALVCGGCGGEDEPPQKPSQAAVWADPRAGSERAGALVVEADPSGAPVFRPATLRAPAGRVVLELRNPSQVAHSLCVESEQQGALGCTSTFQGDRGSLRITLGADRYTYYCNVGGHRRAGMRGTLTVG